MNWHEYNLQNEEDMWRDIVRNDRGISGGSIRKVGPHPGDEDDYGYNDPEDLDEDGLDREMETRARLEDEYGGGAGDWD